MLAGGYEKTAKNFNASGDCRLPLLLIGKQQKLRCLKHMNRSTPIIPTVKTFLRSTGLAEKAVLILDNAPTHPSSDVLRTPDGSIECLFLPANTTCVLQPMDQGVL